MDKLLLSTSLAAATREATTAEEASAETEAKVHRPAIS